MESEIRIERVLSATIGRVYDAWTRAELLMQWYCPNPQLELKVQADVQVGGEYVVEMGPHVVRGSYLEVEPPHRLAFSWAWDGSSDEPTHVQVDLSEVADGTLMVLSHTGFANAEDAANHQLGWDPEVERLTALLLAPAADRG
ncbi:SRPBCC domain-containing protein [Kribbella antibiotica]|uniref:SRPBCC domain-containing protein n=1 Tax=Kribbella antibiotica TaxID=190195 RepID=A0A4R4Z8P9_9ACTN|nr:SRPBCC domain-containing protein [Kribbella antibiotica]TDD54681.1 SRPBCC domain-containing protein [Kribbella antibiotica]